MKSDHPTAWWGKAGTGDDCHPLVWHSLDVAAVAVTLLDRHHALRRHLSSAACLTESQLRDWVLYFSCLHDIGKYSYRFQNLRRDLVVRRFQEQTPNKVQQYKHVELGFKLWDREFRQSFVTSLQNAGSWSASQVRSYANVWARLSTGHHGQPPLVDRSKPELSEHFLDRDIQAAKVFMENIGELLASSTLALPNEDAKPSVAAMKHCSWLASGLLTLADWLGSNRSYFAYTDHEQSIESYWKDACNRAEHAIENSGVLPASVKPYRGIVELFPEFSLFKDFEPSPLQRLSHSLVLSSGPQLIVCEDVTGAGKTEASMVLAHRLMNATGGSGLYLGLPTMATANAMFRRAERAYRQLFRSDQAASLILAHSARNLDDQFKRLLSQSSQTLNEQARLGNSDSQPSAASCAAWLADGNKRALIAQVGVGTIDQALQAILLNKHQSLRLYGLFGKVLIVDEVHANDAYMHRLLCRLLEVHGSLGGSAILLSATLPRKMRSELFSSFGSNGELPDESSYPLLSHASRGGDVMECAVDTPDRVARRVSVVYQSDMDQVVDSLVAAARAGRCGVWIRNSVRDARTARKLLNERLDPENVDLFHARYVLGDRLVIENRVVERFGKDSTSQCRSGQILVATQVVEQSLDIDFDVMVSDLAPIDLLIQRAGRLCRHIRDKHGNCKTGGADERGAPELIVLGPDPDYVQSEHWLKPMLTATAKVYPDHASLWLTARELKRRGQWTMPDDARDLIETVYDQNRDEDVPSQLEISRQQVIGEGQGFSTIASENAINFDKGYALDGETHWWSEIHTPTRLAEKTTLAYVGSRQGDEIRPWVNDSTGLAWEMSQIRIPAKQLFEGSTGPDIERAKATMPGGGKWSETLVATLADSNDRWEIAVKDAEGVNRTLYYSAAEGLEYEYEQK